MTTKRILWIFPLLTQLVFSLFLPFFSGFTLSGLAYILIFATLPAFYFACICLRYQFHQRNLIQIAFWAGSINFINTLLLFSILLTIKPSQEQMSIWEHTFAVIFYGIMFALPSIVYAMIILRIFLPKKD